MRTLCKGHIYFFHWTSALADPGGAAGAPPPQGSRFFHFDIQIFQNVAILEVGAPHEVSAPLREILDPPLLWNKWFVRRNRVNIMLNTLWNGSATNVHQETAHPIEIHLYTSVITMNYPQIYTYKQ